MNVLHLISSGGLYGAEAVILELCAVAAKGGADRASLGVFFHQEAEPPLYSVAKAAGVNVFPIPCKGQLDFGVASRLRALARATRCDLLHAHGYKADLYSFAAFQQDSRPALVSTCHNWISSDFAVKMYGVADRLVLGSFDEVIAVSQPVADQLTSAGVSAGRVSIIRNGVRVEPGAPGKRPALRDRKAGPVLGIVGRLSPEKGIDILLHAVAKLLPEFPGLRLVVAGEGPERGALEALRARLGLVDTVTFLGAVREMDALYGSLDLLVSASHYEGLPMVLLEGMAHGLPVVATAVGEVPFVVEDGVTGSVIRPGDPAVLVDALRRWLRAPGELAAAGEAGRQRVTSHFSSERMAAEYSRVYARALRRRRGHLPDYDREGVA